MLYKKKLIIKEKQEYIRTKRFDNNDPLLSGYFYAINKIDNLNEEREYYDVYTTINGLSVEVDKERNYSNTPFKPPF